MSLRKLREALTGTLLPPDAEEAITSAEEKERQDASYTDYLESEVVRLNSVLGKQADGQEDRSGALRKEWEQSKGKSQSPHSNRLEEVKENILLCLSAQPPGAGIFADHVARQCGVGVQTATHHLEEMNKRIFVLVGHSMIEPPRWSLGPEGRSYLFAHGLIS